MMRQSGFILAVALSTVHLLGIEIFIESTAWARAGGGSSSGSRSSRSFAAPSRPSPVSPGLSDQGRLSAPFTQSRPSPGLSGGSSLMQGIAGGIAGGLLGSMIFGGASHAGARGEMGGGGIGLFEILILCLLAYIGYRFYRKRRLVRGNSLSKSSSP